jgi:hypothetical protein
MTLAEALVVVLDLARENALEADLLDQNEAFEREVAKQHEAIYIVEQHVDDVKT